MRSRLIYFEWLLIQVCYCFRFSNCYSCREPLSLHPDLNVIRTRLLTTNILTHILYYNAGRRSLLQVISPEMKTFLQKLKEKVVVGIVGGSDLPKMQEQMGGDDGKCLCNVNVLTTKQILHALFCEPLHRGS